MFARIVGRERSLARARLARVGVALLAALPPAGCGTLIVTQKSVEDLVDRTGFDWRTTAMGSRAFATGTTESGDPLCVPVPTALVRVRHEPGFEPDPSVEEIASKAHSHHNTIRMALDLMPHPEDLYYNGLEGVPEPDDVHVFLVHSRERMRDLIGRETNATGYYTSNVVCLVWPRTGLSGLRHELVHVTAMRAWGVPERWINEGLAMDLACEWGDRSLEEMCRELEAEGRLPTLDRLLDDFDDLPSEVAYPAVGTFVRYLRETFGLEILRKLWEGGRSDLEQLTGLDREALRPAWRISWSESSEEGDSR